MKYDKFTELFLQNFKKNFFGINATYQYINSGYPEIKKPCLRQVKLGHEIWTKIQISYFLL